MLLSLVFQYAVLVTNIFWMLKASYTHLESTGLGSRRRRGGSNKGAGRYPRGPQRNS